MQKKLSVPLSLCTKHPLTQNSLHSLMLDRFWRDTRKYLGLEEHHATEANKKERLCAN